jgi:hypothetical protein
MQDLLTVGRGGGGDNNIYICSQNHTFTDSQDNKRHFV